jgi:glutamate N-acetyltransferase/amino-acid N-acetyltransferase
MQRHKVVQGGVTAPAGYTAAGVHAGLKKAGMDLAMVFSEQEARVAGMFTSNKIQGAHVRLCRDRVAAGRARAVVINSKNANACNGKQGLTDAVRMGAIAAEQLGVPEETVYPCSTGTIGIRMPMDKIEHGIRAAAKVLSREGGDSAAKAIMTTDTVDKQSALEIAIEGRPVRIGGMAKGSGMIEPNMATMLAFLTTDAAVSLPALQECLAAAVSESFNRISVDGDQSCNDTVLFLANGCAGTSELTQKHPEWDVFSAAVHAVAKDLACRIARDGEGATKFVTVTVEGAASVADARLAARAVANSLLVKTSWYGQDPNWGRVIDAVGYSGADVREDLVDIAYDGVTIVRGGCRVPEVEITVLEKILAKKEFGLSIHLNLGDETDTVYTCDCSEEYVRINSDYMT